MSWSWVMIFRTSSSLSTSILIMELLPKSILGLKVKFLNYESNRLPISLKSKKRRTSLVFENKFQTHIPKPKLHLPVLYTNYT